MRNIWQYNHRPRVRWGYIWSILCYNRFPVPGKRCWEMQYKLGITKPVPGLEANTAPPKAEDHEVGFRIAFLLLGFCSEHLIWNRNNFLPNFNCKIASAWKLLNVCRGPESFNWRMKTNFAHFYGKCNGRKFSKWIIYMDKTLFLYI